MGQDVRREILKPAEVVYSQVCSFTAFAARQRVEKTLMIDGAPSRPFSATTLGIGDRTPGG
jgi:hypothetical protein